MIITSELDKTPFQEFSCQACSDTGFSIRLRGFELSPFQPFDGFIASINVNDDNIIGNDTISLSSVDGECEIEFVSGTGISRLKEGDSTKTLVKNNLVTP